MIKSASKVLFLAFVLFMAAMLMGGCSSQISLEQRKLAREGEREAKTLALEHLEDKYGIKAMIDYASARYSGGRLDYDRMYTGLVNVLVRYNGKAVFVHVEDGVVYDNYQAAELEQATLVYLLNALELPQPSHYDLTPHTRGWVYGFDSVLIHDYYDGTNIEDFIPLLAPSMRFMYEEPFDLPDHFDKNVQSLFESNDRREQLVEIITLRSGSMEKIKNVRWQNKTARNYAPYVDTHITYQKDKPDNPQTHTYPLEQFSDLPMLDQFLMYRWWNDSPDFEVRQEEPPEGWEIDSGWEQITPSYHFIWEEMDMGFRSVFIPKEVWEPWFEEYESAYLYRYDYYPAKDEAKIYRYQLLPDFYEYMDVSIRGEYFVDDVMGWTYDYITFVGRNKGE